MSARPAFADVRGRPPLYFLTNGSIVKKISEAAAIAIITPRGITSLPDVLKAGRYVTVGIAPGCAWRVFVDHRLKAAVRDGYDAILLFQRTADREEMHKLRAARLAVMGEWGSA